MAEENKKCVLVLDAELPRGFLMNTAAILGITIGQKMPELVGAEVTDADKHVHAGIIQFPVPILRGDAKLLMELRTQLFAQQFSDVTAVDFSELAQSCKTYTEYIRKMSVCPQEHLHYIGLAICGPSKKVNHLTGNLPLLR